MYSKRLRIFSSAEQKVLKITCPSNIYLYIFNLKHMQAQSRAYCNNFQRVSGESIKNTSMVFAVSSHLPPLFGDNH